MADDDAAQSRFLTALTTEHFVLQTAANGTITEAVGRASLYIMALSSSLVALGFATRTGAVFYYFALAIIPGVFLLGMLTVLRLIDTALEYQHALMGIAKIRTIYRTLGPAAESYFSTFGRWPESPVTTPALGLGTFLAFFGTSATMVAIINAILAGAGVALLLTRVLPGRLGLALSAGVLTGIVLVIIFYRFQRWRFAKFDELMKQA